MNPQATVSPQPVAPQPTTVSPQGAASVTPIGAPTPSRLPVAPTPVASPAAVATPNFGTAQQLQNIAAYYKIPRDTAYIAGKGQAEGKVAQSQFEASQYQNQLNIEHEKDQLDPSKYQFSKNADGTVTILNTMGQKVSIGQYAALTGDNPAQALQKAGATDEGSQKFIAAYNNLQTFIQDKIAAQHGDKQATVALGDFYKANPGLQNMELGQLQNSFMQQYGSYFGQASNPSKYNQLGNAAYVSPTLSSENSPMASSPYYEMQAYSSLSNPNPITQQLLGSNSLQSQLSQLQQQGQ